jgi:ribonuclease HIII
LGSDEVGTGDFFGPIVVTASYVPKAIIPQLIQLGIQDSKRLDDTFIRTIAPQLATLVTHQHVIVHPEKYQTLIHEGKNMNMIKALMHHHALSELKKRYHLQDLMVIDQFSTLRSMEVYWKDLPPLTPLKMVPKAESMYIAVAVSSMLARAKFLTLMDALSSQFKLSFKLGASEAVEKQALNFARQYGLATLASISKTNFKTFNRIAEA